MIQNPRSPLRAFFPFFLLVIVFATFVPSAYAATYNIGCSGGVGFSGQLDSSIDQANLSPGDDIFNLTAGCVYTLSGRLPTITSSMTFNGNGAIIDGADIFEPFSVTAGTVIINDLTIRNGYGEVFEVAGTVSLARGAAIHNNGGTVTVRNSTLTENGPFAALYNQSGSMTILSSSLYNNGGFVPSNPATTIPAGINNGGSLQLVNSTVANHTTAQSMAIYNNDAAANILISNSTVAGNRVGLVSVGTATLRNSILKNTSYDCFYPGGSATTTHTLIGQSNVIFNCFVTNGVDGNKIGDPLLGALTGSPAYLPITAESPAYNAGNNSDIFPGVTLDQRGNPRIAGSTVDMGAYEIGKPVVRLNISAVGAPEGAFNTLTISRIGSTAAPMTVNLTLTRGTGMTASDYTISGGGISGQVGNVTATIPAGQSSVDLTIMGLNDGTAAEPDNVLMVALSPHTDYDLGVISTATVTIPANGFNVSTLTDDTTTEGTFRQAILNANAIAGNDFIIFDVSGTINLTSNLPDLAPNGRIVVAGSGSTINGTSTRRIFNVLTGAEVRLIQLALVNGSATTDGGAILNAGTLSLELSSVQNSSTTADGGAIKNEVGATLTVTNSTLTGNSATNGGGINNQGTLTLRNSTVAGNSISGSSGAGLLNLGTATLNNSIIADNNGANCSGAVTANFSLVEDGSCGVVNGVNGNKTGDPRLGTLTGSPAFYPLLIGSVAINGGSNALAVGSTDQPGYTRILDGTVDMGAFETTPASLNLTLTLQGRPAAPNANYVTSVQVQIRQPGSTMPLYTGNFVTDSSGNVAIPNIIAWPYDIWIKGSHTLAVVHNVPLVAGVNTLTTALLREGDANDDNRVTLPDFSLLATSFGSATGDPTFDARADFNNDGLITLPDFSLLASNFSQLGSP